MNQPDPQIRDILTQLRQGDIDLDQAHSLLQSTANQPLGYATLDHDRAQRCGIPEVIFAQGKTAAQIIEIAHALIDRSGYALLTRANPQHTPDIQSAFPEHLTDTRNQTFLLGSPPPLQETTSIPIITAGTSDQPVAEEAALTARALGQPTNLINDVGVAGLPRLLQRINETNDANVIICIAGMEGALPSVVGGLVSIPVIAVPTSIGYGASLNGIAALLGMLNSCAAGVSVVNIDNGFGAAYIATLINRQSSNHSND